jgi:hypothetical protein
MVFPLWKRGIKGGFARKAKGTVERNEIPPSPLYERGDEMCFTKGEQNVIPCANKFAPTYEIKSPVGSNSFDQKN